MAPVHPSRNSTCEAEVRAEHGSSSHSHAQEQRAKSRVPLYDQGVILP